VQIVGDKSYLFSLFRGCGYGFAELGKAEHGGGPVSHGAKGGSDGEDCACLSEAIHTEWRRLKRFNNGNSGS
jgi:hypothetical protein